MRLKKYEFDNEYNCPFTAEQVLNGGLDVKRAYFEYRANVLRSLYAVSSKDLNYIRPLYTFINELKALCKNGFEMQLFNDIEERLVVYVEHLKDEGVIEEPNILAKQILNNPKKYLDERNKFYKDLISSGKIEKRMAKHIMLAYSGDCSLICEDAKIIGDKMDELKEKFSLDSEMLENEKKYVKEFIAQKTQNDLNLEKKLNALFYSILNIVELYTNKSVEIEYYDDVLEYCKFFINQNKEFFKGDREIEKFFFEYACTKLANGLIVKSTKKWQKVYTSNTQEFLIEHAVDMFSRDCKATAKKYRNLELEDADDYDEFIEIINLEKNLLTKVVPNNKKEIEYLYDSFCYEILWRYMFKCKQLDCIKNNGNIEELEGREFHY